MFCLVEASGKSGKGIRITALSKAAASQSLRIGQALNDARTICPDLAAHTADATGTRQSLLSLAQWCDRYSPSVAVCNPEGIMIDTTGCAHLFGGEAGLMEDIFQRLSRMGLTVRSGLADTQLGARAIALYGGPARLEDQIIATGTIASATGSLPVDALDLSESTIILLRRLGLKTIRSVAAIPRSALAQRFRSKQAIGDICLRLDQLHGARAQAFQPLKPDTPYRARMAYSEPILDIVSIEYGLNYLLQDMARQLERGGVGARAMSLTACRVDGSARTISVGLSRPQRDPAHVHRLLKERLEQLDPGEGIDTLVLSADSAQVLDIRQSNLDGTRVQQAEEIASLVDRLTNRLGADNIHRTAPVESHIPERALKATPAIGQPQWPKHANMRERPFRLLAHPEAIRAIAEVPDGPPLQFVWRRVVRKVVRARGPERIAPEWWLEGSIGEEVRDYYEVEDIKGHRYWLYRAGLYQDPERKGPPLWFMHGLFA